jgi:hypothetical protein
MRALIPVLLVVAAGSCKPAVVAPPPPPPPKLGPIEVPDDLLAEVLVRDPHALLEALAHATGTKSLDPATIAAGGGPDVAAFFDAVDLKSSAGGAIVGDAKNPDSWHFGFAVKLRDPKGARQILASKVQKGQLKAEESTAIRSKIYPTGKTVFALIGEAIVLSDNRATLESAGRWIAKEGTEGTPPHDMIVRVPLSRYAVQVRNELKKMWEGELGKDPDANALQPFVQGFLGVVSGFGDLDVALDLEKEDAIVDVKLGASGMFSQWLAKYPAGPARSILTMPKSSSAFVVRFPDAVSEIVKLVADDAAKTATQPKKEVEDLRTLARAVGHELAFATLEKKDGKTIEAMVRVDLIDPVAAKTAVKSLIADAIAGKPDRKVVRAPWAKGGADGESILAMDGNAKLDARWAIKGNSLFVDVAWEGKPTLIDNALEPSGKLQLGANPRAKTFADRLPKDGLVMAYYAETAKAPRLEELGAVPSLTGVRWGWASASKDSVQSQWNVPLADLGSAFAHKEEKTELAGPVGIVKSATPPPAPSASAPPPKK